MTPTQLNKRYNKEKAKYLAEIQNDDGSYTCRGCDSNYFAISIHHIIKRSKLKYYYADKCNFIELCYECHHLAEGTIQQQNRLYCYYEMFHIEQKLLQEYYKLKPYEQTLDFKYK